MSNPTEYLTALKHYAALPHDIKHLILNHFELTKRVSPTVEDGLLFIGTELAEASELILREKTYLRNHPDKESYSPERFAEELGDVIYMAMITGSVRGVNPLAAMFEKMKKHVEKLDE